MGGGDRLAHPYRQAVLAEAAGIHSHLGRAGREHASRRDQSSPAGRSDAEHGRRTVPRANAPAIANGGDMAQGAPGIPCFVTGTVRGLDGEPVAGALLDLWQTDGEGLYEDQRDVKGPWMRGLYRTQPDGSYAIRTVAPIAYTIPMDGTVGELMNRTNISHMRPAHIHFAISSPG